MTPPRSFRDAVEAEDLVALTATLGPEVAFNSPMFARPYCGRETVAGILEVLVEVFEDFRYERELVGPARHGKIDEAADPIRALMFSAFVDGKAVQGMDLLTFDPNGLVVDLTVMVRPLPAAMTLARCVGRRYEQIEGRARD